MWPIRDINPTRRPPVMTRLLLMANLVLFVPVFWARYVLGSDVLYSAIIYSLGLVPARLLALQDLHALFTSMFVHADLLHIIGNIVYLHIFGDNVEDTLGRVPYLAFYLACGLAATVVHVLVCLLVNPALLAVPLVGASGAISGLLGAYMVFFPRARIMTAVFYYGYTVIEVKALYYIGFWFVYQLLWGLLVAATGMPVAVAFWAHIGGFATGVMLSLPLRQRVRAAALAAAWEVW